MRLFGFAPEEEGGHGLGGRGGVDGAAGRGGKRELVGAGRWGGGVAMGGRSSGGVIEGL